MAKTTKQKDVRSLSEAKSKLPAKRVKNTARKQEEDDDPYFSRAVGKAFLMLDLLNSSATPVSLPDIAVHVQLTKSSSFRLLRTLQQLKYVQQDESSRYFIASNSWVTSSMQVANAILRMDLRTAQALHDEFHETISIAVLFNNHIEVVRVFESTFVVRMANTVGRILPPHASSLGKAITAFQSEETRRNLLLSYGLVRFTQATITDEVALRKELERIRKNHYAYEGEESTPDGCCFGAPIFLEGTSAIAAISISVPKSRLPVGTERENMIAKVQATAKALTHELKAVILNQQ
jgi:DNA-binding IclR family transcriptional regulator